MLLGPFITAINAETKAIDTLSLTLDDKGIVQSPTFPDDQCPVTIYAYDPKKQAPICLLIRKNAPLLGFFAHKFFAHDDTHSFRPAQIPTPTGEWGPAPHTKETIIRAADFKINIDQRLMMDTVQKQIIKLWYTAWENEQVQKKSALVSEPTLAEKNKATLNHVFEQMKALCAPESEFYPLNEWQQDMIKELIFSSWCDLKNSTSIDDYQTALQEIMSDKVSEGKNYTSDAKALLLYVAAPAINLLGDGKFYAGAENGAEKASIAHVYRFMIKTLSIECGDNPKITEIGLPFKAPTSNTEIEKIGELSGERIQLIGNDLTPEGQHHFENLCNFLYVSCSTYFSEAELSNEKRELIMLPLFSKLRRMSKSNLEKLLEVAEDIAHKSYAHDNEANDISMYLFATFSTLVPVIPINEKLKEKVIPTLKEYLTFKTAKGFLDYWKKNKESILNDEPIFIIEFAEVALALLPERPDVIVKYLCDLSPNHIRTLSEKQIISTTELTTILSFVALSADDVNQINTFANNILYYVTYAVTLNSNQEAALTQLEVFFNQTPSMEKLSDDDQNHVKKIWQKIKLELDIFRISLLEDEAQSEAFKTRFTGILEIVNIILSWEESILNENEFCHIFLNLLIKNLTLTDIMTLFGYLNDTQIQSLTQLIDRTKWATMISNAITKWTTGMISYITNNPLVNDHFLNNHSYPWGIVLDTLYQQFIIEAKTIDQHHYACFPPNDMQNDSHFMQAKATIMNLLKEYTKLCSGELFLIMRSSDHRKFATIHAIDFVDEIKILTNLRELQHKITTYLLLCSRYYYSSNENIMQSHFYKSLLYAAKITSELFEAPSSTVTAALSI